MDRGERWGNQREEEDEETGHGSKPVVCEIGDGLFKDVFIKIQLDTDMIKKKSHCSV